MPKTSWLDDAKTAAANAVPNEETIDHKLAVEVANRFTQIEHEPEFLKKVLTKEVVTAILQALTKDLNVPVQITYGQVHHHSGSPQNYKVLAQGKVGNSEKENVFNLTFIWSADKYFLYYMETNKVCRTRSSDEDHSTARGG